MPSPCTIEGIPVSLLLVSYNTRDITVACLRSVYDQTAGFLDFEVLIVDNASSDGSADAVAAAFPAATLVRSPENLGFAAANNLAAREASGEWLLLLNPDTVVLDHAIDKLLAFAQTHPEASIFGGRTLFADGSLNIKSCWRRPTPWSAFCIATGLTSMFPNSSLFAPESFGPWKRDSVRQVDIVSGCFLLIRRSLWNQLGGFDPAFFMYGEEADLCLRASKLGHKCLICPDATIIHYGGASEKVRADKMVRLFSAKALLFHRHWSPLASRFGIRMLDLWALTRTAAFGLLCLLQPRRRDAYDTWRNVFRRRHQWRIPPQSADTPAVSHMETATFDPPPPSIAPGRSQA